MARSKATPKGRSGKYLTLADVQVLKDFAAWSPSPEGEGKPDFDQIRRALEALERLTNTCELYHQVLAQVQAKQKNPEHPKPAKVVGSEEDRRG